MNTDMLNPVVAVKVLDMEFFEEFGLPEYATSESAGLDLRACIKQSILVKPGQRVLVPTGLCIDLNQPHLMWLLAPKSGLGHKHGIVLGNLVGVIDSDYHKEVGVSVWNTSELPFIVNRGDFVCQAIAIPVARISWDVATELDRSVGRIGGWGSTGSK